MSDFRVLIFGGGVAAVEALLRLRRLSGDRAQVTLVAPGDELVYRPDAVREPFAFGPPSRCPLSRIASDAGAELRKDALESVDAEARVARTAGGGELPFDAVVVAIGAKQEPAFEHGRTFIDAAADDTFEGVVQDVEQGYARSVAFVIPEGPVYSLPMYELALLTADRAYSMGIDDIELYVVTPEPVPISVFGEAAGQEAARLLEEAGVSVHTSTVAQVPSHGVLVAGDAELRPERIIAMPRLEGREVGGLSGPGGFIPVDEDFSVPGTGGRVFAVGDEADYPVKHGGLSSQMADTAASAIARLAGADVEQAPFKPVIRGKLIGGRKPLYVSARLEDGRPVDSRVHAEPPWPEDDKLVAEELGPYLAGLGAGRASL
jgi:sulfide:quinone oxidoreductase